MRRQLVTRNRLVATAGIGASSSQKAALFRPFRVPIPGEDFGDQVRAGFAQERSLDRRFHDAGRMRRKWRNLWRCARSFPIWPSKSGSRWHTTRQPLRMHTASRNRQVAHRERGAGTKRRIKTHARREHRTSVSNISSRKRRKKKLMRLRSLVSMS
jgi:hypothetical protein